jgi:hypothetical protein
VGVLARIFAKPNVFRGFALNSGNSNDLAFANPARVCVRLSALADFASAMEPEINGTRRRYSPSARSGYGIGVEQHVEAPRDIQFVLSPRVFVAHHAFPIQPGSNRVRRGTEIEKEHRARQFTEHLTERASDGIVALDGTRSAVPLTSPEHVSYRK